MENIEDGKIFLEEKTTTSPKTSPVVNWSITKVFPEG
jgi:hypothetical protein